jgi:DNA-binding NarL/FixJ family response regulator
MSNKKKKIVIIDDQPLFRERLSQLLNHELDMEVHEEAENVEQAISQIRDTSPDLAIANITLQGLSGLELIKSIKAFSIGVPVLVLSSDDDSLSAERALRAGATGYITKHQPAAEFLLAVRRVLAGEVYLSENMRSFFLKRIVTTRVKCIGREIDRLAARELDVLALSGRGRTTREQGLRRCEIIRERTTWPGIGHTGMIWRGNTWRPVNVHGLRRSPRGGIWQFPEAELQVFPDQLSVE